MRVKRESKKRVKTKFVCRDSIREIVEAEILQENNSEVCKENTLFV